MARPRRWLGKVAQHFARRAFHHGGRQSAAAVIIPKGIAYFATGLIAAKPEKPCDGGVFRAFYLLLKKKQKRPALALLTGFCLDSVRTTACQTRGKVAPPSPMPRPLL